MKNPELIRAAANDSRFREPIGDPMIKGTARNRLCGDQLDVQIRFDAGSIAELSARVEGCLVTSAAWTITAEAITGLMLAEALWRLTEFLRFLDGVIDEAPAGFGDLAAFRRPSPRRECARLAAVAIKDLLFEQNATSREPLPSAEVRPPTER